MKTSIKIEAIKTDKDGCKLIAFSRVLNFKGFKPQVTPCIFADYKGNELRVFNKNSFVSFRMPNFKSVLLFLKTSNFNF